MSRMICNKKFFRFLQMFFLCTIFAIVISCSKNTQNDSGLNSKKTVITTIFPLYDWAKNIAGDELNVELLVTNGSDLHNFQPTVKDIVRISECDIFIYVGGQSDLWIEDALKNAKNKDMQIINLMESLGSRAKIEEVIAGMEDHAHADEHSHAEHAAEHLHDVGHSHAEHAHADEHLHDVGHSHADHAAHDNEDYDEHIWLSLQNAQVLCDVIANAFCTAEKAKTAFFYENLNKYVQKLQALDEDYRQVVESAHNKTLLFADRFPFRYLVDDYKLEYYAAFAGCSAETEASFKTIKFLSEKLDELNLQFIFVIENSDKRLAKTIIENSKSKNQNILCLDSMQSVTMDDVKNGSTYLQIMGENLLELKKALN